MSGSNDGLRSFFNRRNRILELLQPGRFNRRIRKRNVRELTMICSRNILALRAGSTLSEGDNVAVAAPTGINHFQDHNPDVCSRIISYNLNQP